MPEHKKRECFKTLHNVTQDTLLPRAALAFMVMVLAVVESIEKIGNWWWCNAKDHHRKPS
ncbi:hypothetical protein E2C01_007844 [Portunus trituberculatus]|uniref:Uncharacterized protein n=1 Tax=Portunus trituberculatus TaxID=210409 RepID=A0A5B7D1H5_PORTR|nr:hypothetical protein [Portunus trituberculatus]